MGFGYWDAVDQMRKGQIVAIAIHPPHVAMVTFAMRDVDRPFMLSKDMDFRAAAALTYVQEAHAVVAEEQA